MSFLNPRVVRIVALPVPTERQRARWYFQRYIERLPAADKIVLMGPQLVQPRWGRVFDGLSATTEGRTAASLPFG